VQELKGVSCTEKNKLFVEAMNAAVIKRAAENLCVGIDTNILIRYLQDDPVQGKGSPIC